MEIYLLIQLLCLAYTRSVSDVEKRSLRHIELGCPLCLASLPQDRIPSLPTNLTFTWLVNIFKRREGKVDSLADVKCIHCEDINAQIYKWCVDCQGALCYDCVDAHSELKTHLTVTIKDFVHQPKKKSPEERRKSFNKLHHIKQPDGKYTAHALTSIYRTPLRWAPLGYCFFWATIQSFKKCIAIICMWVCTMCCMYVCGCYWCNT